MIHFGEEFDYLVKVIGQDEDGLIRDVYDLEEEKLDEETVTELLNKGYDCLTHQEYWGY